MKGLTLRIAYESVVSNPEKIAYAGSRTPLSMSACAGVAVWGVELQVGEEVSLLLCPTPRNDIHEGGRVARPTALCRFGERHMCKV